jgi:hypothetical protein
MAWGHCRNCKFFSSPARVPFEDEEAACQEPNLSVYHLLVFGAGGCDAFDLRPGLSEAEERPGLVT